MFVIVNRVFFPVQLHLPVNKEKEQQTRYQQLQ